jgi:hypothetical protein
MGGPGCESAMAFASVRDRSKLDASMQPQSCG